MSRVQATYIWLDGAKPAGLRSKVKIWNFDYTNSRNGIKDCPPDRLPLWGFDGSSTGQAEGHFSDCMLKPVRVVPDPTGAKGDLLILCAVMNPNGTPHKSNTRAALEEVSARCVCHEPLFGIEQEYTLFRDGRPLGFPPRGYPAPQGPYYCSVGATKAFGRELVAEHARACLDAGLALDGTNAEVMPGQWEYQIGPVEPLQCADELWIARWLMERLGETHSVEVRLDPKPVHGDWNGAGAHTNFSTKSMREVGGLEVIKDACNKLQHRHEEHIRVYGEGNEKRLTGKHETCSLHEFRWGVSDRGASIRIPMGTANAGCGYLEDRRPAANMDPYLVCRAILETVCGTGFSGGRSST